MTSSTLNFTHPLLMGILNTTPDSFFDGGDFFSKAEIEKRIDQMLLEGSDILDIGGESSAPNSPQVSVEEEIARIRPALEYTQSKNILVSIDTYKAETAEFAIRHGATIVNDVTAFRGDSKLADVVAQHGVYVVIMYSKDNSARTTSQTQVYSDVIAEIKSFLTERIACAVQKGIAKEKIILDPGMGAFVSQSPEPSLEIIHRLSELKSLGCPLLLGASRKSFLGQVLNLPLNERLEGSLAAATLATYNGANIIRAHDVQATKRVIKVAEAVRLREFD